jgi:hypothetical protein
VVAPAGAEIRTRARWSPDEAPRLDVVAASSSATAYVEVDDHRGRVWAEALDLPRAGVGDPARDPSVVGLTLPRLPPGLYWALASGSAQGAAALAASTTIRPFFVAASDEAALASGLDPLGCSPRGDTRETTGSLWPCLALAPPPAMPRWTALDGAPARRDEIARARDRGLAVALAAVVVAALLELTLLARVARTARARVEGSAPPGSLWTSSFVVAVLLALLGFALLGAFLARTA